ncbi:hypothetical protein, partial [Lentzea sp. NPDC060358]|uniref:hypothetical protein n=1 Tax=Lentzea sp. NPDC060358 TaxID=3347103 RepID=UPI00365D29FF
VTRDAVFGLPHIADDELVAMRHGTEIERLNGDQALACPGQQYQVILHSAPATEIAKWLLDSATTITEIAETLHLQRALVADVVAYLAGAGLVVTARR